VETILVRKMEKLTVKRKRNGLKNGSVTKPRIWQHSACIKLGAEVRGFAFKVNPHQSRRQVQECTGLDDHKRKVKKPPTEAPKWLNGLYQTLA
jgi:hypothetical protein